MSEHTVTGRPAGPIPGSVAAQIAERISRAQDMLGRLGRSAYEPNYAREKLLDAARSALEAAVLAGATEEQLTSVVERVMCR